MPSVSKRGGTWYIKFKDGHGRWTRRACTAENKADAKRLAAELAHQHERQRHGLEPLRPADGGGALGALLEWWLETYSSQRAAHARNVYVIKRHFLSDPISQLKLVEVTPGTLERFLQRKARTLGPESLNHMRQYVLTAFNCARRTERYMGPNPAKEVQRRRVPKRKPDFLRTDEVPRVLEQLDDRWRPLFATAVYTGLRKGELLGLQKDKVDLRGRLIYVARSYDRNTTKGKQEEAIPIARELVPFLEYAMAVSPSDLVFPKPDGSMMREDVNVEHVLRRALGRAGIVLRPKCHMKLWPKAKVRPIRFHDLRHTTASLLLMAGANPAAVQRILRHSDPRITTEVYGHLVPDYLRSEIDRLSFGVTAPVPPSKDSLSVAASATEFGPPVVQGRGSEPKPPFSDSDASNDSEDFDLWARRDSNPRPPASEAGTLSN
jgi:integrase